MGKIADEIINKELYKKVEIGYDEYNRKKEELSEEEFKNNYGRMIDTDTYYKKVKIEVEDSEVESFLLYELLKEQRKSKKSLDVIKGILVGYAILTLLGFVLFIAQFA